MAAVALQLAQRALRLPADPSQLAVAREFADDAAARFGFDEVDRYQFKLAVSEAVARARRGEGPSLVETKTYRYHDHAFGLPERDYRDPAEVEEWRKRDPVALFRARLVADGLLDEDAVAALENAVTAEIDAAIEFAESSPYPDAAAAFEHVYTNPIPIRR